MIKIEPLEQEHWPRVRAIHLEGIASGDATFETDVSPEWEIWDSEHLEGARFVALSDGSVVGWAALSPVSDRCVYAGVAEVSVYVASDERGRGVGRALLERVIEDSEGRGFWTLQAGVFPENSASIRLHERCGFRMVGRRERLGKSAQGVWRDVLFLERRSERVGLG